MAAPTPANMFPASWITDYTFSTPTMSIPTTTITDSPLTDAEAAHADVDIRSVLYSIAEHVYLAYNNMATADKPAFMTISRAQSVNNSTNRLTKTYTFQFVCDSAGVDVVAEA